ncbi:hypothetical protein [Streptomyces sp. NPDC046821]|uniref:hypothetical protein n=1 Tax=Streptomyces sp. NPDC046821 TaxID=3154702 RepID=UPI0033E4DE04
MFRRNPAAPAPSAAAPEVIAINLGELAALEKALLEADRLRRCWGESPAYYGPELITVRNVVATLYQRAGAASVVQPDPQRARLPLYLHEIEWLADAIAVMERRWASGGFLSDARQLNNRFNALVGQARAITHMGGTVAFTPEPPQVAEAHVIPSSGH